MSGMPAVLAHTHPYCGSYSPLLWLILTPAVAYTHPCWFTLCSHPSGAARVFGGGGQPGHQPGVAAAAAQPRHASGGHCTPAPPAHRWAAQLVCLYLESCVLGRQAGTLYRSPAALALLDLPHPACCLGACCSHPRLPNHHTLPSPPGSEPTVPSTVEAQQNAKNTSDLLRRFRELGERMRQVGGGCGRVARSERCCSRWHRGVWWAQHLWAGLAALLKLRLVASASDVRRRSTSLGRSRC